MRLTCRFFKDSGNLMNIKTLINIAFIKDYFENMLIKQGFFTLPNIYAKTGRP